MSAKSALSVALTRIEHFPGQPLFLRRPGGPMTLTQFGRGWLDAAQAQRGAASRRLSGHGRHAPPAARGVRGSRPPILAPLLATGRPITSRISGFDPLNAARTQGRADVAITSDLGLPPRMCCPSRGLMRSHAANCLAVGLRSAQPAPRRSPAVRCRTKAGGSKSPRSCRRPAGSDQFADDAGEIAAALTQPMSSLALLEA